MKPILFILGIFIFTASQLKAQDNVAEIAHSFMKAVKENNLKHIQSRFLDVEAAYAILPKESAGMNVKEKNEKYIKPLHAKFEENFNKIQEQIEAGKINTRKMDLVSYKLEKMKGNDQVKPQAMSLFFNYNKKEHIIPVSVVQIDERWYVLEILYTSNLFE